MMFRDQNLFTGAFHSHLGIFSLPPGNDGILISAFVPETAPTIPMPSCTLLKVGSGSESMTKPKGELLRSRPFILK